MSREAVALLKELDAGLTTTTAAAPGMSMSPSSRSSPRERASPRG
jgi:hypothetical protein